MDNINVSTYGDSDYEVSHTPACTIPHILPDNPPSPASQFVGETGTQDYIYDSLVHSPPSSNGDILPSFDEIFSTKLPTSHHVLKSARSDWAKVLSLTLKSVTANPSDLSAWKKLLML